MRSEMCSDERYEVYSEMRFEERSDVRYERRSMIFRAGVVAFLIPFTFACTAMGIFFSNPMELAGTTGSHLLRLTILVGVVGALLFLVQAPFFFVKKSWFTVVNAFLLAVGFILYLQANIFNWDFGPLGVGHIHWAVYRPLMGLELLIYGLIVGVVLSLHRSFSRLAVKWGGGVVFIQSMVLGMSIFLSSLPMRMEMPLRKLAGKSGTPAMKEIAEMETILRKDGSGPAIPINSPTWKHYSAQYDTILNFSEEKNVILIVLDAWGRDTVNPLFEEHPELVDIFRDFTRFPNIITKVPGTLQNIPQILTGCNPQDVLSRMYYAESLYVSYHRKNALFKKLAESGWKTEVWSWFNTPVYWNDSWISNIHPITHSNSFFSRDYFLYDGFPSLLKLAAYRIAPTCLKPYAIPGGRREGSDGGIPLKRDEEMVELLKNRTNSISASAPQARFFHFRGSHFPYEFTETMERENMEGGDAEDRQALGVTRMVGLFFDRLKEEKVYDNSLIIVMSDHGPPFASWKRFFDKDAMYHPSFFIKRPNVRQEKMAVDGRYIDIQDTTPTILSELGILTGDDAFSVLEMPESLSEERKIQYEAHWAATQERPSLLELIPTTGYAVAEEFSAELSKVRLISEGILFQAIGDQQAAKTADFNQPLLALFPEGEDSPTFTAKVKKAPWWRFPFRGSNYFGVECFVDPSHLPDGRYEAAFLAPRKDGSYLRCRLPRQFTISEGKVEIQGGQAETQNGNIEAGMVDIQGGRAEVQ